MPKPGELTFVAPRGAKKPPRHLADLTPAERKEAVAAIGEKPFRAQQLSQHYFARYAHDPAEWTNIPAGSRTKLAEAMFPDLMSVVRHISCDDDTTRKTLWKLHDGTLVESVLMRYPERVTMCISSQAGCGMNCPFCATGQAGLDRNLSTAEIVHQIVDGMRALRDGEVPGGPARLSNIVFMGMGEPLANYNRVVGAIHAADRPGAGRAGALAARDHRLHRGPGARDAPLRGRGLQVPPRRLAARAGRRAARHPRTREHALEGRRGAGRRVGVRGEVRPSHLHRVRADPRHQRPGVARRPARPASSRASGCTST